MGLCLVHTDQITGEKFHFQDDPDSKGMLDPNATVYRKAVFREYADSTFRTPVSYGAVSFSAYTPTLRLAGRTTRLGAVLARIVPFRVTPYPPAPCSKASNRSFRSIPQR